MNTYRKATLVVLSLAFLTNPLHLSANTAVANGWELQEISRVGATTTYTGIKHTASGSYKSIVKYTPNIGNVTKFIKGAGFFAAVGLAIEGLFGLVDYVMDPENNRVKITKKNTGLWTDYNREIVGDVATAGRYECAKFHGRGGGGGPIVRDFTASGYAYVECNNGYGQIWVYKEEKILTFDQLSAQIFKNAQAGQPAAVAAIGQVADAQVTPQWLATHWESNKIPLAKTNAQERISPTAIALSQAHHSGKKYGGNCTPKDFKELEERKNKYCSGNGKVRCPKNSDLSEAELRRRADNAEQCAIARSTINNKCFAGGDANHKKEARQYWEVYTTCAEEIFKIREKR